MQQSFVCHSENKGTRELWVTGHFPSLHGSHCHFATSSILYLFQVTILDIHSQNTIILSILCITSSINYWFTIWSRIHSRTKGESVISVQVRVASFESCLIVKGIRIWVRAIILEVAVKFDTCRKAQKGTFSTVYWRWCTHQSLDKFPEC